MGWRVGVDSGGTFTDVCLFEEETGRLEVWKVSSTPADPSDGIVAGVVEGMRNVETGFDSISFLGHGTTVSTNALIQSAGAPTGLVTTEGFRDLLEIRRQKRPDLYDLHAEKPTVLVDREYRLGVPERVLHTGDIEQPLDVEAVRAVARKLRAENLKSVAICFLYSFLRSDHEEAAARVFEEEFPEAFVSISSRIAPEFREFERLSTTVINSYLGPVMQTYVRRLVSRLDALGIRQEPRMTQSNGGVIRPEEAAQFPARTLLSGPSTGVVAAQAIAGMTGIGNLITFDMGGTSSDVALLTDGKCRLVSESIVHGHPLKVPMLDIHTVGAGGGSVAYVDSGGLLKVGPRSAGAFPGPACYNNGNEEPTVTDANVLLQTLNPEYLLNGRMKIDQELSSAAVARVAAALGMDVLDAAEGILEIVTVNMAKAIRVISVQRGYDPRDYTLVAFGGAGPVHAVRLAEHLGITQVLIPLTPGILCALGLLMTDLRTDFATTSLRILDDGATEAVGAIYAGLEQSGAAWLDDNNIPASRRQFRRTADVRYVGQNYEIAVPVPNGPISPQSLEAVREAFFQAHKQLYGYIADEGEVQMVTFRLEVTGEVDKVQFKPQPFSGEDSSAARVGSRKVWDSESCSFVEAQLYERKSLKAGNVVAGPAIVDQMDTTTVIPNGWSARVDEFLNLILRVA